MSGKYTVALVGNPNSGKSSLFNSLTGLNQKVGNFPGVTVDKKTGNAKISDNINAVILDLPGTYSLYPKSADEQVTYEVLLNQASDDRPDLIIIIADASNLKRSLLFCTQIIDLKIPAIIAFSMMDIAEERGIELDIKKIEQLLSTPVVPINPRKNTGIAELKSVIAKVFSQGQTPVSDFVSITSLSHQVLEEIKSLSTTGSDYGALHVACNYEELKYITEGNKKKIGALLAKEGFEKGKMQASEIMERYQRIESILQLSVLSAAETKSDRTEKIDKVLLHPFWGNIILLMVLFVLFQSIFWLARYPMDWVEHGFAALGSLLDETLAKSWMKDLLINGLIAGMSGIAVFVPQIMILFGFITILEDTGYMARISFLSDRIMRSAGLNGRSVMPLISGLACAVPAIMATRTILNKKERIITILVTPLISCSARLPVYTMLIALVIPDRTVFGFINLQGLVLMGLYTMGFAMAMLVAKLLNMLIKAAERTFFLMEMPVYRAPRWKNVGITMLEKGKIFIRDVGKIILLISLILWGLAFFGPPEKMRKIEDKYTLSIKLNPEHAKELEHEQASEKLQNSFAGILGKTIEPVIRPLGFDWKIGIALVSSFAAREVFVGTMATLYSVGDKEAGKETLRAKMKEAKTIYGKPVYTLAVGLSLLIFYVFAMQCMSTLAIVKRETGSWLIPTTQFLYMFIIAYVFAFATYNIFK